jgi:hypothetical protein
MHLRTPRAAKLLAQYLPAGIVAVGAQPLRK